MKSLASAPTCGTIQVGVHHQTEEVGIMADQTTGERPAKLINGVDLNGLRTTIRAIQGQSDLANCKFRARGEWIDCGLNRTTISDFDGAGETHRREKPYVNDADEPPLLLGKDQGPNPVEYALTALLACVTTSTIYHAAAQGIRIEALETEIEGDIDLHGFLGLSESVRKGYEELRLKIKIKSDGDPDKIMELYKMSPVFDIVSNPVPVKVDVSVMK
jgi:uncharacterized OsmC-like protein